MRYRCGSAGSLAHGAILVSGAGALREALARRWQSMVRQTQAYTALAAIDPEVADHWGTNPRLTREQRTRAMEKAARALMTGSAKQEKQEAAGQSLAQPLGTR